MVNLDTVRKTLLQTIKQKESDGLEYVDSRYDKEKNYHVIFYRFTDDSYIVWSAYYNGDTRTTYNGFYNGFYNLTRREAIDELIRRRDKN